jgi:hypothetical protein
VGQFWVQPVPPFHSADATAYTGTTLGELSPVPQKVVPAPWMNEYAGKAFEFAASGFYTTSASAGTYTFGLYMGASGAIGSMTAIATTGALSYVVSQTNRAWRIEGEIQIRALGSSGAAVAFGDITNVTSGAKDLMFTTAGGTATVDTTQARAVALGVTGSVAQSIVCRYFNVKMIN